MAIIIMSVKNAEIYHIAECNDPTNAWKILPTMYEGQNAVHTMQLLNTLYTLQMQEGTPIEEFIRCIKETAIQLATVGEEIQGNKLVHLTLNIFPTSYEDFIQDIVGQEQLQNFKNLCSRLLYEEQRQKARLNDREESLMIQSFKRHPRS
uniref:Uncharacterized protein n=1 Tax=Physcomitrium patens TaxID=3218 RepID=A0A2K1L8M9_PHYPA|nr:hypothetical protein PHYPA_000820 [Physcomitrium patens]